MLNAKQEIKFGIAERSTKLAVKIIKLVNSLPRSTSGYAIGSQLIRSGTSIGANLQEAKSAFTKKDFIHCVLISLKEARETYYWLGLLKESEIIKSENLDLLLRENDEIIRILVTIVKKSKKIS